MKICKADGGWWKIYDNMISITWLSLYAASSFVQSIWCALRIESLNITWCKLEKIINMTITYSQPPCFSMCFSRHMATPTMRLVPGAGVMWSEMLRGVGRFALLDILIDFDRCWLKAVGNWWFLTKLPHHLANFLAERIWEGVVCSQRPFWRSH